MHLSNNHSADLLQHLSLIDGVGDGTGNRIYSWMVAQGMSAETVYRLTEQDFRAIGFSAELAARVARGLACRKTFEAEQHLQEDHGITRITIADTNYPALLRAIHQPPIVLSVWGAATALQASRSVALVGSRTPTSYGIAAAEYLVTELIAAGWTTVSGGARGIDTAVHGATVRDRGTTVAVLGSGLLRPYPQENRGLFQSIIDTGGALVSSYPLRAAPLPGNFPARNRTIAGLTSGTVVIQAAEKSGALLTATYALNEGREVGAVPGSIFDPLSVGCHGLITQGATPITSAVALLTMLGDRGAQSQQIPTPHRAAARGADPIPTLQTSSTDAQQAILTLCKNGATLDSLTAATGQTPHALYQAVWDLEIAGLIQQKIDGTWISIGGGRR